MIVLQICIKWGLQHGTSVVPKATSEDHVVGNADVLDWQLSSEDFEVCFLVWQRILAMLRFSLHTFQAM